MKVCDTKSTKVDLSWSNKDHPVWGILKIIVGMGALTLILKSTATQFDLGEVKTIVMAGAINLLLEGFNVKRKDKKNELD